MFENDINKDLLILTGIADKQKDFWNYYTYNGVGVPRVSDILSATIGKQYLLKWAADLGANYQSEREKILATGTVAHEMIEDFLTKGYIKERYPDSNRADTLAAYKCYHNFIKFWNDMKTKGYTINVIDIERRLTCPFYGGTTDLIANIVEPTGISKNYILDFKSSKSISSDYFLQTMMYARIINLYNNNDPCHIDGIGIIRVDKEKDNYEYLIADFERDQQFVAEIDNAAVAMINWYYHSISIYNEYRLFKNNHSGR